MTTYTITDLGILQGDFPIPQCISESGAMAGDLARRISDPSTRMRAERAADELER